mgnify:CR=1 FL=1
MLQPNNYQHIIIMEKRILSILTLISFIILLSGCLTVERKEYTFELTGDNSGRLTIRYINIMSILDDGQDVSGDDFEELINTYLNGTSIEDEYPMATVVSKKLYEQDNQLCAEVIIEFTDLASVKLHQFDPNSGYFHVIPSGGFVNERFDNTNGQYASDEVPIIRWLSAVRKLEFSTILNEPDEDTVSLLPYFLEMK